MNALPARFMPMKASYFSTKELVAFAVIFTAFAFFSVLAAIVIDLVVIGSYAFFKGDWANEKSILEGLGRNPKKEMTARNMAKGYGQFYKDWFTGKYFSPKWVNEQRIKATQRQERPPERGRDQGTCNWPIE